MLEKNQFSYSFAGFFTQKNQTDFLQFHSSKVSGVLNTDIPELAEVAKKAYKETYSDSSENIFNISYFEEKLYSANNAIFVAKDKGKIVGFAELDLNSTTNSVLLNQLYVLKNYQSKGYGSRLVENCFLYALTENKCQAELFIFDNNLSAKRFFRKFGFVESSTVLIGFGQSMKCDDIKQFTPYLGNQKARL